MKYITSFQELDALGEGLSKDYMKKTHKRNDSPFDIEGFITSYLGMTIIYESFAEQDQDKIGFIANGIEPLLVHRDGRIASVVFPKDTVVIEKYLLRSAESPRRRFTLAHEAAHKILEKHFSTGEQEACFHTEYASQASYSPERIERELSITEAYANRLGAAILMPSFLVRTVLRKYNNGKPLICYDGSVFAQKDRQKVQKMASSLGVSYTAFITRLREFKLLECHPIEEYISSTLQFGDSL